MNVLDDRARYTLDASGMFGHIERLGLEFPAAWADAAGIPVPGGSFDRVVVAGMGGSAAAGDYFAALAARDSSITVEVVRGYSLPGYVGSRTLVVALSYSGGTDEALSCYAEAKARGAPILAISNGGKLEALAKADGVAWHRIAYESPPRASLGHSLAALLRVGQRLGILSPCDPDIQAAGDAHRDLVHRHLGAQVPAERNPAKQLAALLIDADSVVVLAAEYLAPAGRRTKNQLAENAKVLSTFEELPEASHNVVVGLEGRPGGHVIALGFDSPKLNRLNRRKLEVLSDLFEEAGGALAALPSRGISRLADQLEATAWGDYLSCYLAILRGVDPTPTPVLQRVKDAMAGARQQ